VMYTNGRGVARDSAQAASWFHKSTESMNRTLADAYRKAAERGDARAQSSLGSMYMDGRGVAKDYAQALFWLRKAAEQGDTGAYARLGVMYANGWGVAKDCTQARVWLRKSGVLQSLPALLPALCP